jgi:hypothetical protein
MPLINFISHGAVTYKTSLYKIKFVRAAVIVIKINM